jgi:predicted ferric reductase
MLIRSDTQTYPLLRYWILGWSAIATFAFLYKRFIYYFFPRPVKYRVDTIGSQDDLLVLSLTSVGPGIKFAPAQYGFVSLPSRKRDEHPLSVLGSDDTKLILGVKVIGKFTQKLSELTKGDEILVRGPFGLLSEKMENTKHAVWIAGGIGITPFLSMAKTVRDDQRVDMYFCASVMPAQVITEPFAALSVRNPNFHWLPCETSKTGRVTAAHILDHTGNDKNAMYLLCGPKVMMEDLAAQFAKVGIKRSHIIYEDFAFK